MIKVWSKPLKDCTFSDLRELAGLLENYDVDPSNIYVVLGALIFSPETASVIEDGQVLVVGGITDDEELVVTIAVQE